MGAALQTRGRGIPRGAGSAHAAGARTSTVLVTEFYTHGELAPDGRNLLVSCRAQQIVPFAGVAGGAGRLLPAWPSRRSGGQREYEIFYGGDPVPEGVIPAWTNHDGLLMETPSV